MLPINQILLGDCLEVMRSFPSNSVDLILTDPPYHSTKKADWDKQWRTDADYLAWLAELAKEWQRLLKPNGSLYCFSAPKMAAKVEVMLGDWFNVINGIRWIKQAGWHKKNKKEELRSYLSNWEEIVFCEHYGADNIAKGEAGYAAKCDELRGFVFEPLRAYLDAERKQGEIDKSEVNRVLGFSPTPGGMASRHYFSRSQWWLPTFEHYTKLQQAFPGYFTRSYESLRTEYESLRRPFSVSSDVPYTDVWEFPTVKAYKDKHPCEKPLSLLTHAITASSRPGAVVLDCFAGSGSTGEAAISTGRQFIGIERDPEYHRIATQRIEAASNWRVVAEV